MSRPTFFAVLGHHDPFGERRAVEERVAASGLHLIHRSTGLSVYCDEPAAIELPAGTGTLVGSVFRNAPGMPVFVPMAAEHVAIASSRGQSLIAACWGDYVAFLRPPGTDELIVLRPPFTDLGVVYQAYKGLVLVSSSALLLAEHSREPREPDWQMVANHLYTGGMRCTRSCLTGIEELLYGSRLVVTTSGARAEPAWSPWTFAAARRGEAPDDLAHRLRDSAIAVVEARLRPVDHVAVMLSGGLDSSILAACVAAAGKPMTCINFTTGDKVGDEVVYAELVAQKLDVSIRSTELRLDHVDIGRSQASHLARPIARSFAQAISAAKQSLSRELGAGTIVDGGGGDNIFCYLQSAAPVADRIRCEGIGRGAWRTAGDIAMLTESGLFQVVVKAAHRAWFRSAAYRWSCDERYLSAAALHLAGEPSHRWLQPPPGALPGAAAHIGVIAVVENLLETFEVDTPECSPLMAQPLVELCLSIPTWLWFDRGQNRALARRAFEPLLPAEIVRRRSKGTPDGFVARVYETNRRRLEALLCEGRLADQGLLDRDAIRQTLAGSGPVKGHDHIRLLRIADVEAWLRGL